MKKSLISLILILTLLFSGCMPIAKPDGGEPVDPPVTDNGGGNTDNGGEGGDNTDQGGNGGSDGESDGEIDNGCAHADGDENGICDVCAISVLTVIDFYNINDLHGKFDDTDAQPGVDELSSFLRDSRDKDEYAIFVSSGDTWQGSSESNATSGLIITDWMNELDFAAMALGNHEFDWGTDAIIENAAAAEFPILAINIFDKATNQRVDYAEASVKVECGGITVGIIGAIGDCYSSISSDKVGDVYFKTGSALTSLIMAESDRLRSDEGVDIIVYLLHDGYGSSSSSASEISDGKLDSYYDIELSDGYVDLVFEGHTHQRYVHYDRHGVYHVQGGGDNKGITHAELTYNTVTGKVGTQTAEMIYTGAYASYDDDPVIDELLLKYAELIYETTQVLGYNASYRSSDAITDLVAKLYYERGIAEWGNKYDIVLGGAFLQTRSPYDLERGDVTYADLWALLPFDNNIHLCSIKGSDLLNKFINSSNSNYHIYFPSGMSIDRNKTYYIVTDSYTSQYTANRLTVVADLGDGLYARDLLAVYIKQGGLD